MRFCFPYILQEILSLFTYFQAVGDHVQLRSLQIFSAQTEKLFPAGSESTEVLDACQ